MCGFFLLNHTGVGSWSDQLPKNSIFAYSGPVRSACHILSDSAALVLCSKNYSLDNSYSLTKQMDEPKKIHR